MNDHRDLTEKRTGEKTISLSLKLSILLGVILASSGILIGAVLPGMITDDGEYDMKTPEGEMDILLETTVDVLDTNSTLHYNVPISTAVWIAASSDVVDDKDLNDLITDIVMWLFPDSSGFSLTVSDEGGVGSGLTISSGSRTDPLMYSDERYVISEISDAGDRFFLVTLEVRGEVIP